MKVYFSHSYRDVAVNSYFLEQFIDEDVTLFADQKTDVWCVAKLERYLDELDGFVSIVTQRTDPDGTSGFSPYIGQELQLARRAQVPRLLFVDQRVLLQHHLEFPTDAVPYDPDEPGVSAQAHSAAIDQFRVTLEAARQRRRTAVAGHACVAYGEQRSLRSLAEDVAEVLRRRQFNVEMIGGRRPGRGLDDIRMLEALRSAELCVFLLPERLSDVHMALAMAHAQFVPSVRLQTSSGTATVEASVTGTITWADPNEMLIELVRQVTSYQEGLVLPIEQAQNSSPTEAARSIGTMQWKPRDDNLWAVDDGPALLDHVHVDQQFVDDEVSGARAVYGRPLGTARGKEAAGEICAVLYEGLRRHHLAYEIEMATSEPGYQVIRSPAQIQTHRTATCLDVVLLFTSLLRAAGQQPLVVVVGAKGFAHALAGYRVRGEPPWDQDSVGDLKAAVTRGGAVLFEATGVLESDHPVGAEEASRRINGTLGFEDARDAASTLLRRGNVELRHFLDVDVMMSRR